MCDGMRVPKDDVRIELNGELDELNALLGMCKAATGQHDTFERLQREVMRVMAVIARSGKDDSIATFEQSIADMERHISERTGGGKFDFVLPGKDMADVAIHLARTKARTCERRFVSLNREQTYPAVIGRYLNRLSDYLFSLLDL